MKWMARLKAEKGLHESPTKPTKAYFVSFVSTDGRHFAENVPPKLLPYFEPDGGLVIPFDSDSRYYWWNGGQTVAETIEEFSGVVNE